MDPYRDPDECGSEMERWELRCARDFGMERVGGGLTECPLQWSFKESRVNRYFALG